MIDLSKHGVAPMPYEFSHCPYQAMILSPDAGFPVYTAYTQTSYAFAEVVYARYAEKLGIPNCKADYAINLRASYAPVIASASDYHPTWTTYAKWIETVDVHGKKLINPDDLLRHQVAGIMATQTRWKDDIAGYVTPDGYFIKANNGYSFYSVGLMMILASEKIEPTIHVDNSRLEDYLEELERLPVNIVVPTLHRIASLSEDDIEACVNIDGILRNAEYTESQMFMRLRLHEARSNAKDCAECLPQPA